MEKSKLDKAIKNYAMAKANEPKNTDSDKRKEDFVIVVKNSTKEVDTGDKAVEDLRKALRHNPDYPGINQDKWNAFDKKGGQYGKKNS